MPSALVIVAFSLRGPCRRTKAWDGDRAWFGKEVLMLATTELSSFGEEHFVALGTRCKKCNVHVGDRLVEQYTPQFTRYGEAGFGVVA